MERKSPYDPCPAILKPKGQHLDWPSFRLAEGFRLCDSLSSPQQTNAGLLGILLSLMQLSMKVFLYDF